LLIARIFDSTVAPLKRGVCAELQLIVSKEACPGEHFQSVDLGVTPEKVEMEVCALICKSFGRQGGG
jgi:hypothetical protein